MPLKIDDVPQWQHMLGNDWQNTHMTWLHQLGNLTLAAYNGKTNKPFGDKKRLMADSI